MAQLSRSYPAIKPTQQAADMSSDTLSLTRPDDWHLHLRDGAALQTTVPHSAAQFGRAIIMPNLKPPVTRVSDAQAYRQRILDAVPADCEFDPLMTLYLTDSLAPTEVELAAADASVQAIKYYPAGATTNSDSGVTAIEKVYPALEAMEACGLPLLIHGEVTDSGVDIFDREPVFIDKVLAPLVQRFPKLRVVLEHITTQEAVAFVKAQGDNVAATITVHHLLYNRNHLLAGGVRPHFYCLPILKRDIHQQALIDAATSGNSKFFLGTDSAPHVRSGKETSCGCAGIYSAPAAIELYAEVFARQNALDKLESFASFNGADFYKLPRNTDTITLHKRAWTMPDSFPFNDEVVVPICAGETIAWQLAATPRNP